MSIFGFLFKRSEKSKLKQLSAFASCFKTLDQLFEAGMLSWNEKQRRLFIMQPLALLMMKSPESWQNFIRNIYLWTYYREVQHAWNDFFLKAELKAIRDASKNGQLLSEEDVERIRRASRAEVAKSDMQPPKIEPFEFYILPDSKEASVKPVAVGYFDAETNSMELASWQEMEVVFSQLHSPTA